MIVKSVSWSLQDGNFTLKRLHMVRGRIEQRDIFKNMICTHTVLIMLLAGGHTSMIEQHCVNIIGARQHCANMTGQHCVSIAEQHCASMAARVRTKFNASACLVSVS